LFQLLFLLLLFLLPFLQLMLLRRLLLLFMLLLLFFFFSDVSWLYENIRRLDYICSRYVGGTFKNLKQQIHTGTVIWGE
jgi:hypothetical protein